MMYLKSERYTRKLLRDSYDHTEYRKMTPAQFAESANSLVDNLLFLVPVSNTIKNQILNAINNSSSAKMDFANAIKVFNRTDNVYNITLDLKALTGNGNLGDLSLKLNSDGNKITSFDINVSLISIVKITLNASLSAEYNGTIEYGVKADANTSAITDMASYIPNIQGFAEIS